MNDYHWRRWCQQGMRFLPGKKKRKKKRNDICLY
jgi:hypothetical protein